MARSARFPLGTIAVLGLITIAGYGAWAYSFGVLLDPLLDDTGWSEGAVAGGFAVSSALGGLLAFPAGRLLDAVGSRWVFALAATVSTGGLVAASYATALPAYLAGSVVGGSALGGLTFYHVTQTVAVRAAPGESTRAIAWLTIFGAFSSAIYLPVAALLVDELGWRAALRILGISTGGILVGGVILVRERERPQRDTGPRPSIAFDRPEVRRFVAATACVGVAIGTILVYQVPLMVGAGLPLATAATIAGLRGASQILGRIPLMRMVERWGPRRVSRIAYTAITVGIAVLGTAGEIWIAVVYALVAGFGIGAQSPLQGIYADALFDRRRLGAAMGTVSMVFGLSVAAGPAIVGVLSETTGSRLWGVAIGVISAMGAVALLRPAAVDSPG